MSKGIQIWTASLRNPAVHLGNLFAYLFRLSILFERKNISKPSAGIARRDRIKCRFAFKKTQIEHLKPSCNGMPLHLARSRFAVRMINDFHCLLLVSDLHCDECVHVGSVRGGVNGTEDDGRMSEDEDLFLSLRDLSRFDYIIIKVIYFFHI